MDTSTNVIMPVLGMIQDSGKIIRWLKAEGERIAAGEPLIEVETDKAVAEIEAPASGVLARVTAHEGDDVPVGTVIAVILSGEATVAGPIQPQALAAARDTVPVMASPVAARMAAEHHLDLSLVQPDGGRVEKADVLAYLEAQGSKTQAAEPVLSRTPASPKARRLAAERGLDLAALHGTGPGGAVLASDVLSVEAEAVAPQEMVSIPSIPEKESPLTTVWRIMAERTTASWTTAPHFFLIREVNASRLIAWRESVQKGSIVKITYSDLLVKLVATALRKHPRINATWKDGRIIQIDEINIGLAVAVDDGLVAPVIHGSDKLTLSEIAAMRDALVTQARSGRLRLENISGGTFTISNLGMYGVDVFNAIINSPQAAILAVGRIADRVIAVNGLPAVAPVMVLSLSFDHRVVDGARGAQFLETLADLIEEPLGLLK